MDTVPLWTSKVPVLLKTVLLSRVVMPLVPDLRKMPMLLNVVLPEVWCPKRVLSDWSFHRP
jgi:hypothetical protein